MNRVIKFRVWRDEFTWTYLDKTEPAGWLLDRYVGSLGSCHHGRDGWGNDEIFFDRVTEGMGGKIHIEQFTGLIDSQGREIYEGDILLASEARYEMTLDDVFSETTPPVYVEDRDKSLPAPDVPWFKAVVEWNQSMCGFWIRYLEKRADWGPGTSTPLNDKHYTYVVIGNVHENPITSSGPTS